MAKIVLGLSGSIAAYKAIYLTRLLTESGHDVHAMLTKGAERFVGPLSFAALTGNAPITDLWAPAMSGEITHVELAHCADLVVVAPATAHTLAKLANGLADDPLSALILATSKPILIAPAMETGMWQNPMTQANLTKLAERMVLVPPESGELASGRTGEGRMAQPETIAEAVEKVLAPQVFKGQKIVITAGATREHIDPVRFLSNPSSGRMGIALAAAAHRMGAKVELVCAHTDVSPPKGVAVHNVTSTLEMLAALEMATQNAEALIMAAAPADFRPRSPNAQKIKKSDLGQEPSIQFVANPDILTTLKGNFLRVGFAAETEHLEQHARTKLEAKRLDLIVANCVAGPHGTFGRDDNEAILIDKDGSKKLPRMTKFALASAILLSVASRFE